MISTVKEHTFNWHFKEINPITIVYLSFIQMYSRKYKFFFPTILEVLPPYQSPEGHIFCFVYNAHALGPVSRIMYLQPSTVRNAHFLSTSL